MKWWKFNSQMGVFVVTFSLSVLLELLLFRNFLKMFKKKFFWWQIQTGHSCCIKTTFRKLSPFINLKSISVNHKRSCLLQIIFRIIKFYLNAGCQFLSSLIIERLKVTHFWFNSSKVGKFILIYLVQKILKIKCGLHD